MKPRIIIGKRLPRAGVDVVDQVLKGRYFGLFMALTFVGAVSVTNIGARGKSRGMYPPQLWAAT